MESGALSLLKLNPWSRFWIRSAVISESPLFNGQYFVSVNVFYFSAVNNRFAQQKELWGGFLKYSPRSVLRTLSNIYDGAFYQSSKWPLATAYTARKVSFFWSVFLRIWTEYGKIQIRKNSVFGHFSYSDRCLTGL